jgi:hypothetical protein
MSSRFALLSIVLVGATWVTLVPRGFAGPYAPAAGQPGSTAISKDSSALVAWAASVESLVRGPQNITNPGGALATFGSGAAALGPAGTDTTAIVSLGDGGAITLGFALPIVDGPGADFAVFENGFADEFLELAFVEVSSNGTDFVRFPAASLTPTDSQVGSFGALDPTNLHNLAGKYRVGFGTPFDLTDVVGLSGLVDVQQIHFVRIVDVVGTIDPTHARLDSLGNTINDPYATAFASGGFDLDAVGVMHQVPEPSGIVLAICGLAALLWRRRASAACSTVPRLKQEDLG